VHCIALRRGPSRGLAYILRAVPMKLDSCFPFPPSAPIPSMVRARAIADYEGTACLHCLSSLLRIPLSTAALPYNLAGDESAGTLSLKEGQTLIVTEQQSSGWWVADVDGRTGLVPSTCARRCLGCHSRLIHNFEQIC
jgi:hypothetical protein